MSTCVWLPDILIGFYFNIILNRDVEIIDDNKVFFYCKNRDDNVKIN